MNVSTDTQETIVSALMKNSYLFAICKDEISDGYFTSPSCKVIYKSLTFYYNKYKGMPRLNELLVSIDECYYSTCGANLSEVKDTCCRLWELPESDESFIKDKVTDFVRKVRSSNALKSFVDQLKVNPSLESDTIVTDLIKALEVQLSESRVFNMNDPDQVDAVRRNSVGSVDQSKIIRSFISSLNKNLMFGGFQPGTVNMIVAPPGCFTGDTRIITPDSEEGISLEELYLRNKSPIEILGYDQFDDSFKVGIAKEVILTKYIDTITKVILVSSKGTHSVRCTPDHLWLTYNSTYKRADSLVPGDLLLAVDDTVTVESVETISYKEPIPVYDVVDSTVSNNFTVQLDQGVGVVVHNCGKSMYLINEGVNAAQQGFEVLHVFIGDMVEYDGFIRYLSRVSSVPQNSLVMMPLEKQVSVVEVCNQQYNNIFSRITMTAYPSLSITVDTLMEDISKFEKQLEKDFDMIIVDYPDNLILDGKSLYEDGGTLYSSLEKLARLSKSVVLVASQPQKLYWSHQIIPLEAAAESSKKQQAVDIMLTMNTEHRGANFGTLLLAKARKGEVGKIFRFKTDFAKCLIEEVDEGTFQALRASYSTIS